MSTTSPALIYNLFPRLFKTIDDWTTHLGEVKSMNFNSIYVNPFHAVGGSDSLYAVKDYFKLNSQFLPKGASTEDFKPLEKFTSECKKKGIKVHMDLVINHTANESDLITQHPQWFKKDHNGNIIHPYAIDPANPSDVTVWGDLSEIDYENNPDMEGLIEYWDKMIAFYQEKGFDGFRCDAAYKIPGSVWHRLITSAKKRKPDTEFLAETLGCTLDQTQALNNCGFDYLFNSSKWWNFEGSWCIDQHCQFRHIAPSVSFPESHDTVRLALEQPSTLNMQKNRFLLATIFSKGILMPSGYEYGNRKNLNVVNSVPEDLNDKQWDLQKWIKDINSLKLKSEVLSQEGKWNTMSGYDWDLLFLKKETDNGSSDIGVMINKDWYNTRAVNKEEIPSDFSHYTHVIKPFSSSKKTSFSSEQFELQPSEIVLFVK
ncbi:Alpha-amylase [Chitinispirillum alkaliphilum]|nr:Alpha-amylase [Chitinispirillum alkaliphilum]